MPQGFLFFWLHVLICCMHSKRRYCSLIHIQSLRKIEAKRNGRTEKEQGEREEVRSVHASQKAEIGADSSQERTSEQTPGEREDLHFVQPYDWTTFVCVSSVGVLELGASIAASFSIRFSEQGHDGGA
jgi:hypothetical protein